jgi:hypothetical protein
MTDLRKFAPKSLLGCNKLSVTPDDVRSISAEWNRLAKTEKSERIKSRSWEKIKDRVINLF